MESKELRRFSLRHFMQYQWLTLIIMAVASFAAFYYPINAINAYSGAERLDCFFLVSDEKVDYLSGLADGKDIYEVDRYFYSPDTAHIGDVYTAYGVFADLLLVRDVDLNDAKEYIGELAFALPEDVASSISLPLYTPEDGDGKSYGAKIYDGADEAFNSAHHFTDWLDFGSYSGAYYLILGPEGENLGQYKEGSANDAAIRAYLQILEDWA